MRIFAYIDPASGSILLQAIIAAIVGLSIRFRKVLTDFVRRPAERRNADTKQPE
ncbi:MAG TPA: hypothetical protein VKM94_22185 [Blastocatellia bacterium]|nr:hypothetical protein [Blastocatellia bacterium]